MFAALTHPALSFSPLTKRPDVDSPWRFAARTRSSLVPNPTGSCTHPRSTSWVTRLALQADDGSCGEATCSRKVRCRERGFPHRLCVQWRTSQPLPGLFDTGGSPPETLPENAGSVGPAVRRRMGVAAETNRSFPHGVKGLTCAERLKSQGLFSSVRCGLNSAMPV